MALPAMWGGADDLVARHEFALVVWSVVALGALIGVLPRASASPDARPLLVGLSALVVLTALGLIWTSSAERTMEEIARVSGYAGVVVLGVVSIERRRWRSVASGASLGAVGICALAMTARLSPLQLPDIGSEIGGGRLSYPFDYWNALAAWAGMSGVIALAWAANTKHAVRRSAALAALPMIGAVLYLTFSRGGIVCLAIGFATVLALSGNRRRVIAQLAIAVLCTAGIIAVIESQPEVAHGTGARGAGLVLLALIAGCTTAFFAARRTAAIRSGGRRKGGGPRQRPVRILIAVVVLFALLAPAGYIAVEAGDDVAARFGAESSRLVSLEGSRPLYWREALDAAADLPLTGVGPGTYEFWWSRSGAGVEQVRDAHSLYLEAAAELGLPGLAVVIVLIAGAIWLASVPFRQGDTSPEAVAMPAALAVYGAFAAIDWVWESTAVTVLAMACAVAGGAAGSRRVRRRPARPGPGETERKRRSGGANDASRWSHGRRLSALALIALSIFGIAIQVPGLVSTERMRGAESARLAGLHEIARARVADAISAAPWAASPYAERALIDAASGDAAAAVDAQIEAVEREPLSFRRWLILAELQEDLGNREGALVALEQSRSLAPSAGAFSGEYGRNLLRRIRDLPD